MPDDSFSGAAVHLVALTRPFATTADVQVDVSAGLTLREMLVVAGIDPDAGHLNIVVCIDDWVIERRYWSCTRPKAGRLVTARVVPTGGGGGGKSGFGMVLKFVFMIAAAVVAPYLTPIIGTVGAALASAAISLVGGLITNALVPPSRTNTLPSATTAQSPDTSRSYALTAGSNSAAPYAPVPLYLGLHRVYPLYGAMPYSEISGDDQYLRLLFLVGYGPVEISDLKLGDTPLNSTNFPGLELEIRQGWASDAAITLYPDDVFEEAESILLGDSPAIRTTAPDSEEIVVDIAFPQGLQHFNASTGTRESATVDVIIDYGPVSAGVWNRVGVFTVTASQSAAVRRSYRWSVGRGQYDVRVYRASGDTGDTYTYDDVYWSALRSIKHADPIAMPGVAKVALRLKASGQLSGTVSTFNCLVRAILPDWTGAAWVTQGTSNPAAAFRAILQGPANQHPLADDRLDLASLQDWAEYCSERGWEFNAIIDFQTTVAELLRDIASAGRAALALPDGRYGVVIDRPQTVPVQLFTPRNSWNLRTTLVLPELPHAVRLQFVNAEVDYQRDELVYYGPGYDEASASVYETMSVFGVTQPRQAWEAVAYCYAVGSQRRETVQINVDVEHLVCTRGDLVALAHDVLQAGQGWARVSAVTGDILTFDDTLTFEAGKSYAAFIRKSDGSIVTVTLINPGAGRTRTVPAADTLTGVAVGDLVAWGETTKVVRRMLVREIEVADDLSAVLKLIDEAPAVYSADHAPPSSLPSSITWPGAVVTPPDPTKPSGLRAVGLFDGIQLTWANPLGPFQTCQLWVSGTAVLTQAALLTESRAEAFTHSALGWDQTRYYWLRAVNADGSLGAWSRDEPVSATTRVITYGELARQVIDESLLVPDLVARIGALETLSDAFVNLALQQQQQGQAMAQFREDVLTEVNPDGTGAVARAVRDLRATIPNATAIVQEVMRAEVAPGNSLAQWLAHTQSTVGENTADVEQINSAIDGVKATAMTKVQLQYDNGKYYLASFGLNATLDSTGTPVSEFGVIADRFFIGQPGSTRPWTPFFVEGGRVYIDTAFIRDLTVDTLKIRFGALSDFVVINGYAGSVYADQPSHLLIICSVVIEGFEQEQANYGLYVNGQLVKTTGSGGFADFTTVSFSYGLTTDGGVTAFHFGQVSGHGHPWQSGQFTVFVHKR